MNFRNTIRSNGNVLVFRKWGRKNYSVFSTLKKVVHISVLAFAYFVSVPVSSFAFTNDTTEVKMEYDLDEIDVTASRVPVLYSQVARVLTVIDAKEIERMPVESIQDLLEYVTGVDIRQRGAEGVQADVSIRGGTFDQILILLNGINITDPQTGHHNLNLPVSLSQIGRIEILNGPAARIYGPNAFSGAINIITRKPSSASFETEVSAGSFGYLNTSLLGSLTTGKLSQILAISRKSSQGYTRNTDFYFQNAFYSGEYASRAGRLFYQGGAAEKGFGANSFYTPVYPNQYEEVKTLMGSVRFESNTKLNLTPSFYWRRHSDKFMLFRNNPPAWYTKHNYHRTDTWGIDVNSWFVWTGGKTSFGAAFRSETILSNVLGELMQEPVALPGNDVFYTHSKNRRNASVFAEHALFLDRWTLNAGVMANHISDREGGMKFFPGIDVSYQLSEPLKIIASWNTSLRMPTFTDLYYKGPTNLGNPGLSPERSEALEGGLRLSTPQVKGYAGFFHRKGSNLIDWVKSDNETLWKAMNHTEIKSQGIELNLLWLPKNKMGNRLPEKIEAGYLYNQQDKKESNLISYYVMDNLKHKFVASVTQRFSKDITFDLRAVYQDREGSFTFYESGSYGNELEYRPFWTVDAKTGYSLGSFGFYVSVNNLFNSRYYDIGNVIQPGRWLKAGISYRLGE